MKPFLWRFLKGGLKVVVALTVMVFMYAFFVNQQIKKVDKFCSKMTLGLDVSEIHKIAEQVNIKISRNTADAIKNRTLGVKVRNKEDTWVFFAFASLTMGDYACGVYHDYNTVLSAETSW